MTKLENGSEIRAELSSPEEKHDYYLDVEPHQPATVTFVAPSLEYAVKFEKVAYPLEKGGPANAHDGGDVEFTTEQTFSFAEAAKHRVWLTVVSANPSMLPSDGYTIRMSVDAG